MELEFSCPNCKKEFTMAIFTKSVIVEHIVKENKVRKHLKEDKGGKDEPILR